MGKMNFSSALLRLYLSLTYHCLVLSCALEHHGNALSTTSATVRGNLGTFAAEKIIEKIQSRMRYGFPLLKIEPMSPMKINNRQCSLNLSFLQLNSSLDNLLLEGIDRFTINRVKFNWRNKSMDFSLTFHDLSMKGNFDGSGSIIKYIPIGGSGNFTYTIYNLTTNVFAAMAIKDSRLQVKNFTMISMVDKVKSNIKGLTSDNFLSSRVINRMLNRLIELTSYNVFKLNQRLINYAIRVIAVPRINRILTLFVVLAPSTKFGHDAIESQMVYFHEIYDENVKEYLTKHPLEDDLRRSKYRNENDHYNRRIFCA